MNDTQSDLEHVIQMLDSSKTNHVVVPIDEGFRMDIRCRQGVVSAIFYDDGKFASIDISAKGRDK